MRNKYFSTDTISKKSAQFQSEIKELNLLREKEAIPSSTALLILDMQRYFLESSSHAFVPSAEAIIPGIKTLHKEFNKRKMLSVFTQHIDKESGMMPVWWKNSISENDPLGAITPELDIENSVVLSKSQYDAFWGTNLQELLNERKITDVIITGVMTHLCCETTARSAFVRGYNVIFTVDGTATYNEDHHLATLKNLAHGFAHLKTIPEVIDSLP